MDEHASSLFVGLSGAERSSLWECGQTREFAAGARLFSLGEEATHLYVVERGRVALKMPVEVAGGVHEVVVEEQGPGATIGWSALVPPHRYTLSAVAIEDAAMRAFSPTALTAHLEANPEVGWRVFRNLAAIVGRRLVKVEAMWIREVSRSAEARLREMK